MKLNIEDYENYKKQIEQTLKISLMAVESDKVILESLNKKITSLEKSNKNPNKENKSLDLNK